MIASPSDNLLRALAIVLVVGLGAVGLALPGSILIGGCAWLVFVLAVLSGWGYLVARALRVADPDFGLRAAWGVAAYLAVAGVPLAAGVLARPVVLGALAIGLAGFAWRELVAPSPSWHAARAGARSLRARPLIGAAVAVIALAAAFHLVAAVAELARHPWDDDVAYTPMVARLLDAGNLIEPFSFRRLGSFGGQTVLQALGGARGTLASVHLLDHGVCQGLCLLLVTGYARELGRVRGVWLALIALVVLLLRDDSLNTASYWSGFALMFALYRSVVRARAPRDLAVAALVGAAACTLRASYLVPVVLFLAIVLVARREGRRGWLVTAGTGALVLAPYGLASYLSSGTFLFPLWSGNWNTSVPLRPIVVSWVDELQGFAQCLINTEPFAIIAPLFVLLAFTRDERRGRPLTALFAATALGFAALVHGFLGTDPYFIWRYAFGPAAALLVAFALEVGATDDAPPIRLAPLGRWILLACLVLQLVVARTGLARRYAGMTSDLREAIAIDAHGDPTARAERARYAALQAAIPAHVRVAVMLDQPAYLDFARDDLANLDTPAFASPPPGWPAFQGPAALRDYLLATGYRYVAFVRPDRSAYFYRRDAWLARLFDESDLFTAMAAHAIDASDTLVALAATSHVLYDEDGLVALDLGDGHPAPPEVGDLAAARATYIRALAEREHLHGAWSLSTRPELRLEDGFSRLEFIDERADDPKWYDVTHPAGAPPARGTPARWMHARCHVRLRGAAEHVLSLRGKVNVAAIFTRPRLELAIDGEPLGSIVVDADGRFEGAYDVPALGDGWHDLYLTWSSGAPSERDSRDLHVARLEQLEWEPR
ncbi:MAG TPA: hypothetical protein VLX92_32955 [Kofleriaceae bacterium]|nr:hypothetical protein [Kofleriaceae bacterium]